MDFTNFEFISILHENVPLTLRDFVQFYIFNKQIKRTIQSSFLPSYVIIKAFVNWKDYTKKNILEKKYKRRTSWIKKPRNEETELLFF